VRRLLLVSLLALSATSLSAGTGRVVIVNIDQANIGFNDSTPVAPVGGNPATTLGAQRLFVFETAAARWTAVLDTNVNIRIRASFAPLECGETSTVLGSASAISWRADFSAAPRPKIYYPIALANKFANQDLTPNEDDIRIQFNGDLDKPTCAGDRGWYYGLDGKEGTDDALFPVVLHEIAHGLGMSGRGIDFGIRNGASDYPSIYDVYTLDRTAGRSWDQMTLAQRNVSSTNTGNLVWTGPNVTEKAAQLLERVPVLTVTAPANVARSYDIGTAAFGPVANRAAMAGQIVAAIDASNTEGPSTTDGCTTYENAAEVAGKIALVDRGTCTFVVKALAAQAAGAVGVVLADNRKDTCLPPGMSGSNDAVMIPMISITQDEGAALRAASGVSGVLRVDPTRMAGASPEGNVRLYAPCTFNGGSSIYHWDTPATPNLLMEPFISGDLIDTIDLSIYQMMDIGWTQPPRTGRRILRR
jgi:hypothetical protein